MRKLISILCLAATIASAWADGMVVSQTFRVKVEIPNQQALLCLSNGVEKLVIETAFIGEGTNFAWVVPLPAAPEVRPVSTTFFPTLRAGFAPHLVHQVPKYYVGTLFLLGLVYLGWRCLRGEVSPIVDLPLCLAIGAGVWIATNHVAFGIIALSFALLMRSYANSSTSYALILIVGAAFAPVLIHALDVTGKLAGRLINTMGSDASLSTEIAGVEIVSVQHAGLFDVTTIKGTGATGVLSWLEKNGYEAPPSAEPVIQEYVRKGWVFVASKVRRTHEPLEVSCVHPLAFIFPSKQLIYPTRLTGLNEQDCLMELFVFGDRRAMASGFKAVRCERLAGSGQGPRSERKGMRIEDPELLEYVGSSTVGTLLRGKLSPRQMAEDVVVKSTLFWRSGRHVYSRSAALTVAANVGLPLIALAWIAVGMCAGGWRVDEKWILRWRVRWMAATVAATVLVYVSLPVVEVEQVIHHHSRHDDFARLNPGIPVLENGGGRGYGHERESHNSEGRHVLGGSSHCRFSLGS